MPNRWKIGDVTITRVVELEMTGGTRFILPDALQVVGHAGSPNAACPSANASGS